MPEILLNASESRSRRGALAALRPELSVLELCDSYEAAGNQLYRLAETLREAREVGACVSAAASFERRYVL